MNAHQSPITLLNEEHQLLLQAINIGQQVQEISDDQRYYALMHDLILFFRNYTEVYHYPKEEYILYPLLRGRTKQINPEHLEEIFDNHEDFKSLMAQIEMSYEQHDYKAMRRFMLEYLRILEIHISNEDKTILLSADKLLTPAESDAIVQEFNRLDEKHGDKLQLKESLYKLSLKVN